MTRRARVQALAQLYGGEATDREEGEVGILVTFQASDDARRFRAALAVADATADVDTRWEDDGWGQDLQLVVSWDDEHV